MNGFREQIPSKHSMRISATALSRAKSLWITETADAACGGNSWVSTFLDTFRDLNQLGSMAQRGVDVVMHNTLDASDYGLLDENTLAPRPDYWAALLWRKLMGTTVLNPGAFSSQDCTSTPIVSETSRGE